MSSNEDRLRGVADSWIIVSTVLLALQLSASIFTVTMIFEKQQTNEIYIILSGITVAFMGITILLFISCKDPRLEKYSITQLFDRGIGMLGASGLVASITAGFGTYGILENIFVAFGLFIMFSVIVTGYAIFYRKYLMKNNFKN